MSICWGREKQIAGTDSMKPRRMKCQNQRNPILDSSGRTASVMLRLRDTCRCRDRRSGFQA